MSEHVRKQIRNAAKGVLQGLATTGDRVYISRVYPLAKANLPGLLVFTPAEDSAREDSPTDLMRDMILQVHGVVAISGNLEDEMDDIALEVEVALDGLGLAGLAKIYHGIQGTVSTLAGEDVDKPHGAIAMEFLYTYRTVTGSPDVAV